MAAKTCPGLSAAEEEQVIKSRFLNQAYVPKGDPPFKRLAKGFHQLCDKAGQGRPDEVQAAYVSLLREVAMLELQADKYSAILMANQLERQNYHSKQQKVENQIEQTMRDIEAKKIELEEAKVVRQHNEEYEVLRQIVMQTPARAVTQREIDKVKADISKIEAEGRRTEAIMQRRRQQFALLFHVIEELQRTAEEPDEPMADATAPTAATAAAAGEDMAGAGRMEVD